MAQWRNGRLPKILVLTIDGSLSAQVNEIETRTGVPKKMRYPYFKGMHWYVLRVFPLCALVPRVQGSSGAVATVQFVWRGHAKTPTTRAGPWPDFALRLE